MKKTIKKIIRTFRKRYLIFTNRSKREGHQSVHLQRKWEDNWSKPDYSPNWTHQDNPLVLRQAVEMNWFTQGSSILDIGCGTGELSSWLAESGFIVTGMDISSVAIKRAQTSHQHDNLKFIIGDICQFQPDIPSFDHLFDRGCFHLFGKLCASNYIEIISSYIKPGGKFLLIHNDTPIIKRIVLFYNVESTRSRITRLFSPNFTIEKVIKIDMRSEAQQEKGITKPGFAFMMTRK